MIFGIIFSEIILDHMKKLPPIEADDIIEPDGKSKKCASINRVY